MNTPSRSRAGGADAIGSQDQSTSAPSSSDSNSTARARAALDDTVAVVVTETLGRHTRRVVYLSLDAAVAARERALTRGNRATVVVCQLVPLDAEVRP